jgi:hypothetical protein
MRTKLFGLMFLGCCAAVPSLAWSLSSSDPVSSACCQAGTGTAGQARCCAPGADCCNPPQECCFTGDCPGSSCCAACPTCGPQESK